MGKIKLCPENISGFCSKFTYGLNHRFSKSKVGRFFKLEARKTCFTQEVRAATATFLTMAYIISVNATILADSGVNCFAADCSPLTNQTVGVDLSCVMKPNVGYQSCLDRAKKDLVVATILSSMIGSFAMGIFANLPLGLAPGMGGNAYVAYNLVGFHGSGPFSYKTAMAIVLVQGCAFLAIAGLGLRAKLARLIPKPVRLACAAGIGLFIAFVGLQIHQGVGLIGPDPSTLVTVTACSSVNPVTGECLAGKLHSPTFWLGVIGFIITCYGLMNEVKGSMIFGILFITLISWIRNTSVTYFPNTPIGDSNFNYFKKVVDFHKIESTAGSITFNQFNTSNLWISLATLLYVEVLATTGTLYTMAEIGGFVDEKGNFEGEYSAFIVDASSTIVGAALGVSPMAVYVESSAGIREGGKTGLTAVIVGFYFLGSLFFTPLLANVPPWAIGPSLVVVGIMMAKVVKEVNWIDLREAVPAFITMLLMPLTYSIANGIVGGIGVYVALNLYDYVVRCFRWVMKMRRMVVKEQNQVSASENPSVEII